MKRGPSTESPIIETMSQLRNPKGPNGAVVAPDVERPATARRQRSSTKGQNVTRPGEMRALKRGLVLAQAGSS